MKIPLNTSKSNKSQKLKKTIWDNNLMTNKQVNQSSTSQEGDLKQRSLRIEKSRLFKPFNNIKKNNVLTQKNQKQPVYDENAIIDENMLEKQIIKQNHKENQNIKYIYGQLETYENIKFNSCNQQNYDTKSKRQDFKTRQEDICQESHQQKYSLGLREPLCDISNKTQNIQSQNQNELQEKQLNSSLNSIFSYSKNSDDENERILSEILQQQNIQREIQPKISINSTILTLSASSVENQQKNQQNSLLTKSDSNQSIIEEQILIQNQQEEQTSQITNYFDGYQVFQKREKVFSFKIFKEDFLKIPTEYSKIITHSQDDDVSSDEDVVRGGIKYNYKSIIKEIYKENEIANAPQLVISSKFFQ